VPVSFSNEDYYMSLNTDTLIHELKHQIRLLGNQNEQLAVRMQEKLLLLLVQETIQESNDPEELLTNLLERISVILDLPCSTCCQINENQVFLLSSYATNESYSLSGCGIQLPKTLIDKLYEGPQFISRSLFENSQVTGEMKKPTSVSQISLFPFQSLTVPFGVFIFFEEISGKSSLFLMKTMVQHLISFAVQKLEKLSLLKELKELNYSFESKVRLRTEEIRANYEKIRKELNKFRKKDKKLTEEGETDLNMPSAVLNHTLMKNIGMEIRTPLNCILGFAEMVRDDSIQSSQKNHFIDIIKSCGKSLMKMVDDAVDYSWLISGNLKPSKKEFAIAPFFSQLYDHFKMDELLRQRDHLILKLNINVPVSQQILTDQDRLWQVMSNLIGNAIKFTGEGVIEIGCIIGKSSDSKTSRTKPALILFVKDTGIGIDTEVNDQIFDPFFKVEHEISKLFGGIGLGLTIAKNITQLMGGHIWYKSSGMNAGSEFYVELTDVLVNYTEDEASPVKSSDREQFDWADKLFLVVEDDEMSYLYLKEIFKTTSASLLHAKTGPQAIEMFKENADIDLVLMDIKLPGISGYEATKQIKQIRNVPVIAQTAYAMADDQKKSKEVGCDEYISKPINRKKLLSIITTLLRNEKG
jgi:signal transduction histidine kinase/ActR/RegA family two-component response regulator